MRDLSKAGRLLIALGIGLVASSPLHAQAVKEITIATEGAFPPWNLTEAGGKITGFDVDVANEVCKRAQITCRIVAQDWDGIIPALNARKHDAVMSGMNITDKRLAVIGFSRPYATSRHVFATLTDSNILKLPRSGELVDITELSEPDKDTIESIRAIIKGKAIGVQTSTNALAFLEKHYKGDIQIREYKTAEQHDLDLVAGRIDGIFVDYASAMAASEKNELAAIKVVGPGFRGGLLGRGVAIGLRKEDGDTKSKLDAAITAAIADGTIKNLSLKWFKMDMTPPT